MTSYIPPPNNNGYPQQQQQAMPQSQRYGSQNSGYMPAAQPYQPTDPTNPYQAPLPTTTTQTQPFPPYQQRPSYGPPPGVPVVQQQLQPTYPNPAVGATSAPYPLDPNDAYSRPSGDHRRASHSSQRSRRSHHSHHSHQSHHSDDGYDDEPDHHHHHHPHDYKEDIDKRPTMGDSLWSFFSQIKGALGRPKD